MSDFTPPRPTGDTPEARFMQWVWDQLVHGKKLISVPGQIEFSETPKGIIPKVHRQPASTSSKRAPKFMGEWVEDTLYVRGDMVCKDMDGFPAHQFGLVFYIWFADDSSTTPDPYVTFGYQKWSFPGFPVQDNIGWIAISYLTVPFWPNIPLTQILTVNTPTGTKDIYLLRNQIVDIR